jgi:thiol-disulfide isomerase/thioredoxin
MKKMQTIALIVLAVAMIGVVILMEINDKQQAELASGGDLPAPLEIESTNPYDIQSTANKAEAVYQEDPRVNYLAPRVELPNLADEKVTIGGERANLSFINFWAAWCGPCNEEAPDLQALSEEYAGRIEFLGVNATSLDRERDALEFIDTYRFTFPTLMDREGTATNRYYVNAIPVSLLVDKDGIILERINGTIPKASWQEIFDRWLEASN